MTMYHSHHTTPVHLGGKNSPQVLLLDCDHAELHAKRFISGLDNGFHMGLLPLLSEELELQVKNKQSEIMKTDRNPFYGTSYTKGKKWFSNGRQEVLCDECPEGFVQGRLPHSDERNTKCSQSQKGKIWWNNGTEEKWSHDKPEGFVKGRLKGRGNTPKPVNLLDTHTKETLHFQSYKECYTYLEITRKVFMNCLNKGKEIHNRYIPCKG